MRQNVLRVVRILIFIDQDVLKALLQLCENIRMVAQRMAGAKQQIIKIQRVVRLQKVLIFQENARNCLFIKARRALANPSAVTSWFLALLIVPCTTDGAKFVVETSSDLIASLRILV